MQIIKMTQGSHGSDTNTPTQTIITAEESDQRLDKYLRKLCKPYADIKLGDIFSRIRTGHIKINGSKKKQDYRLIQGDILTRNEKARVKTRFSDFTKSKAQKVKELSLTYMKKMLVHEDEHRLVRSKPPSLVMHPGNKHMTDPTLHDYMMSYLTQTKQKSSSETFHPSFCYRLDKDTSGLVISAKTYAGLKHLNEHIRERKVEKIYHAIVAGTLYTKGNPLKGDGQGSVVGKEKKTRGRSHKIKHVTVENHKKIHISAPLFSGYNKSSGKSQTFVNTEKGKEALTIITPIQNINHPILGPLTLIQAQIKTGRMHQIRVHCTHLGYPIIGDITYGNKALNRIASKKAIATRQLLHASSYGFQDPFADKRQEFTCDLPEDFQKVMS